MKNSLKDVWGSLVTMIKTLFVVNPILVIFCGAFFLYLFRLFIGSPEKTVLLLSFLVFFLTLIQYIINKKYAESSLSFLLGILTVYTIEWTDYRAWIFVVFYISLNIFMMLIASVKISSEVEVYLIDAAYLLDPINTKQKAEELNKIIKESKTAGRLSLIDKAIATYQFVYFNLKQEELKTAYQDLEMIKVIYRLNLEDSIELFKSLFQIGSLGSLSYSVREILDIIHNKRLTFMPLELKEIIISTRNVVKSVDLIQYFNIIKRSNEEFLTKEETIKVLNNSQ